MNRNFNVLENIRRVVLDSTTMHCRRPSIIRDSLDNHLVTFPDETTWQLTKKLTEKPWEGTEPGEREEESEWVPDEAHAVYECVQTRGPRPNMAAIIKIRLEYTCDLPKLLFGMTDIG